MEMNISKTEQAMFKKCNNDDSADSRPTQDVSC